MTTSPRPAESPLREGLAGVGRFGALHAAVLSRLAGVDLVALAAQHSTIDAELAVVGTAQTARIQPMHGGLQLWNDRQAACPDLSLWPQLDGRVHGALQEQLLDFLAAVRLGRPSPIASLADAVQGLRVAEAIIESARLGTTITLAA